MSFGVVMIIERKMERLKQKETELNGQIYIMFPKTLKKFLESLTELKLKYICINYCNIQRIYTESGKAWPYIRKCQEELAISVERDQKKIQKNLQSLIYSNEEMMSDLNTMNEKTKKENQDLKKQIAELKEWKQQQQRDLEEEKKEDDDPEFDVKKWLKKINLEKYGDLLIESGFDDLESILDVNIDDLKEIGIVLGHRKKII
eukprot:482706_1